MIKFKFRNSLKVLLVFFNLLFLIIFSIIPATEQVKLYKYIYENKNDLDQLYYKDDNPYYIAGLNPKLYTYYLPKIKKLNDKPKHEDFNLITRYQLSDIRLSEMKCIKKYSVYPDFIYINPNWKKHKFNWFLFSCRI